MFDCSTELPSLKIDRTSFGRRTRFYRLRCDNSDDSEAGFVAGGAETAGEVVQLVLPWVKAEMRAGCDVAETGCKARSTG